MADRSFFQLVHPGGVRDGPVVIHALSVLVLVPLLTLVVGLDELLVGLRRVSARGSFSEERAVES